jgi:hypothetical protein
MAHTASRVVDVDDGPRRGEDWPPQWEGRVDRWPHLPNHH